VASSVVLMGNPQEIRLTFWIRRNDMLINRNPVPGWQWIVATYWDWVQLITQSERLRMSLTTIGFSKWYSFGWNSRIVPDWKHWSGSELQLDKEVQLFCALQISLTFWLSGRTLWIISPSAENDWKVRAFRQINDVPGCWVDMWRSGTFTVTTTDHAQLSGRHQAVLQQLQYRLLHVLLQLQDQEVVVSFIKL